MIFFLRVGCLLGVFRFTENMNLCLRAGFVVFSKSLWDTFD